MCRVEEQRGHKSGVSVYSSNCIIKTAEVLHFWQTETLLSSRASVCSSPLFAMLRQQKNYTVDVQKTK